MSTEEVVEPELEVVDAHHHLWPTANARGAYDLPELLADLGAGHRVARTVFVECGAAYRTDGPPALRPVGEVDFVSGRARQPGGEVIGAIVGHADLTLGADVGEVLDAQIDAGRGLFRGIRHSGARPGDPAVTSSRGLPPAGLFAEARFLAGARELAARGLSFEAWQYHHQLGEAAALARAVPDLTVVVNHLGAPLGVGRYAGRRDEVDALWREGIRSLAASDNTVLKIGGIGMSRFGGGWTHPTLPASSDGLVRFWRDRVAVALDAFGPDRCLAESNFPVDRESADYVVIWNALKRLTDRLAPHERAEVLSGTARRVYRLP